ncbi:hypothetical protein D3C72_1936360 [compost metagenome]
MAGHLSSPCNGEGDHVVVEGAAQTSDVESPPPSRRLRRRATSPLHGEESVGPYCIPARISARRASMGRRPVSVLKRQ